MISTQALELRAGARLLVKGVTVRINSGDRIGFVGRNGAGKSTLAKVLAGETMPAGGAVNRTGKIGYLNCFLKHQYVFDEVSHRTLQLR